MKITYDKKPVVLITVNGPGELYYWVMPLLDTLVDQGISIQVWIFLTPCQFSSGREYQAIRENKLITKVYSPSETVKICWGRLSVSFPHRGIVLFLGGDMINAVLLKRKSGYPLWIYGSHLRWSKYVNLYLARYHSDLNKYQFPRKLFIGDLLQSYVKNFELTFSKEKEYFPSGSPRILFLPGSRSFAYEFILHFYQQVSGFLRKSFPRSAFAIGFPDFYSKDDFPSLDLEHLGLPYFFGETSQLISQADLTITIPGSNNLELFYQSKKALIVLPLQSSYQNIPLTGLPEMIGKIPGLGSLMKRVIIRSMNQKKKWISLPNILMDREIYPELRGVIQPEEVASKARDLLINPYSDIEAPEDEFPSSAVINLSKLIQEEIG